MNRSWLWPVSIRSTAACARISSMACVRSACITAPRSPRPRAAAPRPRSFIVATVGMNFRSPGLETRAECRRSRRSKPIRTLSTLMMVRSLKPGADCRRASASSRQTAGTWPRHAVQEHVLAEIVFVVARHEEVGRDQVGERDDVLAAVDARHQRGRQRVAAVGEQHVPALGALGLDHAASRGKPPRRRPSGIIVSPIW